ncbi:hypothetical protein EDD11_004726 [Mortierella claussenii]|nr:hypothetical protein EDD11_004726 [Mortierella claussenii]
MHAFPSASPSLVLGILVVLCVISILPIPVRSQSSSGTQVQFPSSSTACTSCKPAFSSIACQSILNSIAASPSKPMQNTTLAECQCTGSFLALYNTCVQCFQETNQLSLIFGSSQPPTQASLNAYCNTLTMVTTITKTITMTTTTTTATSTPTSTSNPSSATSLKMYHEAQTVGGMLMMYIVVAAVALAYFAVLS